MLQRKINIRPDVPVDMALAYTEGKEVKGTHMMFSTVDQRVLFVPIGAGHEIQNKLRDLGIRRGERILVCQERNFGPEGAQTNWNVFRAGFPVGEQPDGGFVVPVGPGAFDKEANAGVATPAPAVLPVKETDNTRNHTLLSGTRELIDVYAAALAYAKERYGEQVIPEAVRALLLAALARGGKV